MSQQQEKNVKNFFEPKEHEAVYPKKYEQNIKKELNEFKKQASKIDFCPLGSRENFSGNYDNYLSTALKHISQLKHLRFDYALKNKKLYEGLPDFSTLVKKGQKVLLIDLDETLIHSDFNKDYINDKANKYDTIIKFKDIPEDLNINCEDYLERRRYDNEYEKVNKEINEYKVGIFVRKGVKQFLTEVSKYFVIGIFTASVKEYADAIIDYLDPNKNLIKFRLYRNNCINVDDKIYVKDLRILKGVDLKDIIILDNSIYSFAAQLRNGILVNSFFIDKNDIELYNVLGYLLNCLVKENDVRVINEQFFNFEKISNSLSA